MLITGIYIAITGMVAVFLFLYILIMTMHLSAKSLKFINKYFPEAEEEEKGKLEKVIEQHDDIAIVVAAITAYAKG